MLRFGISRPQDAQKRIDVGISHFKVGDRGGDMVHRAWAFGKGEVKELRVCGHSAPNNVPSFDLDTHHPGNNLKFFF
jgi:hypothetical protein